MKRIYKKLLMLHCTAQRRRDGIGFGSRGMVFESPALALRAIWRSSWVLGSNGNLIPGWAPRDMKMPLIPASERAMEGESKRRVTGGNAFNQSFFAETWKCSTWAALLPRRRACEIKRGHGAFPSSYGIDFRGRTLPGCHKCCFTVSIRHFRTSLCPDLDFHGGK
jgi:hypothetical protein